MLLAEVLLGLAGVWGVWKFSGTTLLTALLILGGVALLVAVLAGLGISR